MAAPSLREVQEWMAAQILPGRRGEPSAVALNPQRGAPGVERLAVYAGGYRTRIEEALAEVYEAVRHVAGRGAFHRLAHAYVLDHPSRTPNLTFVGRALPDWLPSQPIATDLPFLPDLARLEWTVCLAVHAAEAPPVQPSALAGLSLDDWARTRVRFQPSVAAVASAWPILDIWQARTQPREAIDIALDRPQRVLVFRTAEADVRCELLDAPAFALLSSLLRGEPLASACDAWAGASAASASAATDLAADPGAWLGRWAQRGLLVGLNPAASAP